MLYGNFSLKNHSLTEKVREAVGGQKNSFVQPFILGVCGGSGSGKSTFCEMLCDILGAENIAYLRQDDYYRDISFLSFEERCKVNFDHPDAIEFPLLSTHLEHLREGKVVAVPKYDFATHARTTVQQIISPKPVIVVEGILLFADNVTCSKMDLKIFIDSCEEVRFRRRLKRDVRDRGRTPESVQLQLNKTVRPMHNLFVEANRGLADRVVSGEDSFEPTLLELTSFLLRHIVPA